MNQGLESRTVRQATATDTYSEKWWRETKRMVNRGYDRLVRKGRITPEPTMRELIRADFKSTLHHDK